MNFLYAIIIMHSSHFVKKPVVCANIFSFDAMKSINRTIRIKLECFDKLMEVAEKHNISFNKVVCQCLNYALENIEE